MESEIAWLQPEQEGPASDLFNRIWKAQQDMEKLQVSSRVGNVSDLIGSHVQQDFISLPHENGELPAQAGDSEHGSKSLPYTNGMGIHSAVPYRTPENSASGRKRKEDRDKSCTVDFNDNKREIIGVYGGCPWQEKGKLYSKGIIGLHEEIEDFFQYMSPTPEEHQMRTAVFESIRAVIVGLWSQAEVYIFGSFETGLYLPTSDIDIVVMGKWDASPLEMLKDALVRADICDPTSVKVLDKAAVPIIKLTDKRSEVKVDISFNMNNGLVSANQIKQYQAEYPHMPKLVIVIKQFLLQRELNEVFTGGISSYSLILMTVSFLQTHERRLSVFPGCNLAVLLIEFFEMYGIKFNYFNTCIKVKDRGYAPRSQVEDQFVGHSPHNSPLCIEDPHNSTNDIGRSSYNMMKVKEAFKYAYHRLSFAVLSQGAARDPNRFSILGRIVRVTDSVVEYRRWIREQFPVSTRGSACSPHSSPSPLSSDVSDQDVEPVLPGLRDASPAGSTSGSSSSSGGGRRPLSSPSRRRSSAHGHQAARHRRHYGDAVSVAGGTGVRPPRRHQGNAPYRGT